MSVPRQPVVSNEETVETSGHRSRLRQEFLRGQLNGEEELLELLLTYSIPRRDTQAVARRLLARFGSIEKVLTADMNAISRETGTAGQSATLLKLVSSICYRARLEEHGELFKDHESIVNQSNPARTASSHRAATGLFGKAILKEAIEILPRLPDTDSLSEVREFLRNNLHFNAEQTRIRNASYITKRMFFGGIADSPLRVFAKHFSEASELREVCYYRFCKAEPLMLQVVEDLLIPSLGHGKLSRQKLRSYLFSRFPESKSIGDCAKAIVDALVEGGIASADRRQITFAARSVLPASFAFILHSEFPERGIYGVAEAESSGVLRCLLWTPERILSGLYELRNLGIISKISEIDSVRQFTLKFDLPGMVNYLLK